MPFSYRVRFDDGATPIQLWRIADEAIARMRAQIDRLAALVVTAATERG